MLRFILIGSLCAGLGAVSIFQQDAWRTTPVACCPENVAARLQQSSVMVVTPMRRGSGMLFRACNDSWWVWTAAHVVNAGHSHYYAVRVILPNGQHVQGFVARYSKENDIALIRLQDRVHGCQSVVFHDGERPSVGEAVYAVGSPCGDYDNPFPQTVTAGIISYAGRDVPSYGLVDQCSAPTIGGNSGGMIALQSNGQVLGIVSGGPGESFTLYIPTWRIREYARTHQVEFAVNPTVVPPEVD